MSSGKNNFCPTLHFLSKMPSFCTEMQKLVELAPLQRIRDNYEKIVLSLEPGLDNSYEGIKSENLIEWLLAD